MNPIDPNTVPATPAELLELLKAHADFVGTVLAQGHTSWMPQLMVLTRNGPAGSGDLRLFALAVPFNTADEKRARLRRIGRQLYADQAVVAGAVMSTEAWVATIKPGDTRAPADCPDRREAIVAFGASLGGRHSAMMQMIVGRDPENRILTGTWDAPVTEGIEVRLLNHLWDGFFEDVIKKYGKYGPGPGRDG